MRIKYQDGVTKRITARIGKINKARFTQYIDHDLRTLRNSLGSNPIEVNVASLSSSSDFYDQILSILSFLRHVGTPANWTIYSDGSHTAQQIQFLENGLEFVKVKSFDFDKPESWAHSLKASLLPYKEILLDYAQKQPMGKKLFYYLNHQVSIPTLFLDSDILFYKKASLLRDLINEHIKGWFLPDAVWGCLDSRYISSTAKQLYQANAGFFFLKEELSAIETGLAFLKSINFRYEYFSEQTTFHIIFRAEKFFPLDPRIFILNTSDQFTFSYLHDVEEIAIRHYTGPVRHKMWQRDWKWHLSID